MIFYLKIWLYWGSLRNAPHLVANFNVKICSVLINCMNSIALSVCVKMLD